ncbi:oligosaccharide flippase family protein [Candidatus Photodesmus anomalopis]|nr:oligosaccharide flippase family protein [Candidatus Photodesmus katoptron]
MAMLILILLFSIPEASYAFNRIEIIFICLVLCFETALNISTSWLRLQDKVSTFFIVSTSCCIIQITGIILVLKIYPDITLFYVVGVLSTFIQLVILHFINQFQWQWNSFKELKILLRYSTPLMISTVITFGLTGAEKWIIGYSTSMENLGLYSIATKFSLAMCILVQPFGMWWIPKRFQSLEEKGKLYTVKITQFGILYISILSIFTACTSQIFIQLLLEKSYHNACYLIIGAVIIAFSKEITNFINIGILNSNKTHWILKIDLISSSIGLALCYTTVSYGIVGILLSVVFGQILRALLIFYFSQKILPLPYQSFPLIIILLITGLCLLLSFFYKKIIVLSLIFIIGITASIFVAYYSAFFTGIRISSPYISKKKNTNEL